MATGMNNLNDLSQTSAKTSTVQGNELAGLQLEECVWVTWPDAQYNSIGGAYLPMGRPFQKQEAPNGVATDKQED